MSRSLFLAGGVLAFALIAVPSLQATDVYWDINGVNTGATDAIDFQADGDATLANWSTDSAGLAATATWVTGDRAIFSAGTNANASEAFNGQITDITGSLGTTGASGVGALSGVLIEEGEVRFGNLFSMIDGSIVEVAAGATLRQGGVNFSAPTGKRFTFRLDGTTATLKHTNTGFAGSFISTLSDLNLNGGGTIEYTTANQLILINPTSSITGTGNLVKEGPGVIAIAGAGSYTGDTIINNGEIRIRTSANRLPIATNVTVNSPGILNLNGVAQEIASLSGNGDVGIAGTTSTNLTISGSSSTTYTGALKDIANAGGGGGTVGLGGLVKNGTGTITFQGVNTINRLVTLNSGGITVDAGGSLCGDLADLTVNGGTLELKNGAEAVENLGGTGGTIKLSDSTALTVDPATSASTAATTFSGVIEGNGSLIKQNTIAGNIAKTLSLSGLNTYSGGTTINGGRVDSNSATGTGTGDVAVNSGGTLGGTGHVPGDVTVASSGKITGGIGTANGSSLTVDGTLGVAAGGNVEVMIGAPGGAPGDFNNNSTVDAADFVVWRKAGPTDTLPNDPTPGVVDSTDYDVWRANFGSTASGVGTADKLIVSAANALTLDAGSIVTVTGGGNVTPSGTYTVLEYNTGYTGSLASVIFNNATGMELVGSLVDNTIAKRFEVTVSSTAQNRSWIAAGDGNWSAAVADASNWSPSGAPNGPGAVANFAGTGAHMVDLSDTDKTAGTLNFNNTSGYTITASGINRLVMNTYTGNAAINVTNGNHTISAPMTIAKATTATISNGSDTLTLSGDIANLSGISKAGSGTLDVTGVVRGTGSVTVSSGTMNLAGSNAYTGGTTVAAGAILNANNTGTTSATGTGSITVAGTLNVNLGGRVTGTTTINSGGVQNVFGSTTGGTTVNAGGADNISGTASGSRTIAGGTVTIDASGVLTGTSTISANGTLTGTGTAKSITVNSTGHLQPGGIGAIGTFISDGTVTLNNSSVFNFDILSAGTPGTDYDYFAMTSTTANTLVVAAPTLGVGASIVVNDLSGGVNDINGSYVLIDYNASSAALATSFTSITGPAGHTYTVTVDNTLTQVLLTIAASPGIGTGASVPEPGSMVLLLMALATAARTRRCAR
ncbi:MAG: autotransporter-associated beta strand repeat-containing protein [Pirellulales bacterium]|nr:autotransporter-associated beta strand repeat-containing protein [Pirellulales bacterium]